MIFKMLHLYVGNYHHVHNYHKFQIISPFFYTILRNKDSLDTCSSKLGRDSVNFQFMVLKPEVTTGSAVHSIPMALNKKSLIMLIKFNCPYHWHWWSVQCKLHRAASEGVCPCIARTWGSYWSRPQTSEHFV